MIFKVLQRLAAAICIAGAMFVPLKGSAGEITAHDFAFAGIDGDTVRLADWAGRPVLVVNTASRCAFTHQYDALQALYDRYRDSGLVVLGVPSDDFGGQELATEQEVKTFCEVNFAIDFPMTGITPVKGKRAHPFYAWTRSVAGAAGQPSWNFHKILVGPDGQIIEGFGSSVKPDSREITSQIEAVLGDGNEASG